MKKMMILAMTLVLAAGMTACGATTQNDTAQMIETEAAEAASEMLAGGWEAPGNTDIGKHPEAKAALEKAAAEMTGAEYEPVSLLATQVVAGTNYCILCKVTAVVPDAQPEYDLVYVYEDLDSNAEITAIREIVIGTDDDNTAEETEDAGMHDQIANPWSEYATVSEAGDAAGISFNAPEKLGDMGISYIQAMNGLAEVRYGTDEAEITYRKGAGTDDISGDYNEYAEISEAAVAAVTVTLRGNDGKVFSALWDDGANSYAYYAANGVTAETAQAHIAALIAENHN